MGIHMQPHRLMEGFIKYAVEMGSGAVMYSIYQVSYRLVQGFKSSWGP
jgi:hypothetical protein